jgi:hypothetical protein
MKRKGRSAGNGDLFIEGSGQLRLVGKSVEQQALEKGKVECLGMRFDSEDARRTHFTERLREKLTDPEFRRTAGFPEGADEDIIRMSDAPWYTACPNPFLAEFVSVYGKSYDPAERYERDAFAVDVSVGKTDALYRAHAYHTKVPHLAIVPTLLNYTEPGDLVLDGFCGSGMTGVAAQWCGSAPTSFRKQLEGQWESAGRERPKWGYRRAILNDLSPAATFIAACYNTPFSADTFDAAAQTLLADLSDDLGWMYETLHSDGKTVCRINFTVWSEVFSCPECSGDVVFLDEALDEDTKGTKKEFDCPHCTTKLTRRLLERKFRRSIDRGTGLTVRSPTRKPIIINYSLNGKSVEKKPDLADLERIDKIEGMPLPVTLPLDRMMHASLEQERWGDEWRSGVAAFTHVHHLFLPRAALSLAGLWDRATKNKDKGLRSALLFFVEQAIWSMSLLNRYRPTGYSQVNQYMSGRIRLLSQHAECSPWYILEGKADRLAAAFRDYKRKSGFGIASTGDCGALPIPSSSIDYVFTDPPFGQNFFYSELNFIIESWHKVFTNNTNEAIVSEFQKKTTEKYQELMRSCFAEYGRVLKPGRWMTVVFSNSSNAVWRAIQEALGTSGFVVADVRTLDKQQGSFHQVTSTAVKQDLVISAYKPTAALADRFALGVATPTDAWAFVNEHLGHVPIFSSSDGVADVIAERMAHVLHDRVVAFHVQRQMSVPLSTAEFLSGLSQRYPERDGMYFLATQVAEYDRKRNTAAELRQLNLFVVDEASAIQWVRRELQEKPRGFQDLQPPFMREVQNWARHEQTVELKEILRQNFIHYDGNGPVPSQIHSYLSTNFKDLRNLSKDDPALIAKAADRWYVPDSGKQGDLDKLREKALLMEFATYKQAKERKLKLFRTEAVRAGFKAAYDGQDYRTIVSIAAKLPEDVLQEDEKLLMYYDVASMRLGDE